MPIAAWTEFIMLEACNHLPGAASGAPSDRKSIATSPFMTFQTSVALYNRHGLSVFLVFFAAILFEVGLGNFGSFATSKVGIFLERAIFLAW
jgi:hypothetical protein